MSSENPPVSTVRNVPQEGDARSIVVLDADGRSRGRAESALRSRGYRVFATGDPATAATATRQETLGLLLVDMGMSTLDPVPRRERRKSDPPPVPITLPDRAGYAILCSLEAEPDTSRCPVVILKEDASAGDPARRFALVGFVAKPFTEDSLATEVRRALPRPHGPAESAGVKAGVGFEELPKSVLKALIVDGDASYRQFIKSLLVPHGFEVFEATEGKEGLRIALSRRPWLILTEVNMPGMDGFEFCRQVKRHSLLRQTPLVFLSAWDDYWERYHGLTLKAEDYLSKQTPDRELLIRMQLVLKRYSDVRTSRGTGMEGGVDLIGVPGMLQMCHLGRFSGVCTVRSRMERIVITFRDGEVVAAESSRGAQGAEAVYELLCWTRGHFEFVPGDPGEGGRVGESFDHLLLEGCRRLDEQRRDNGHSLIEDGHTVES